MRFPNVALIVIRAAFSPFMLRDVALRFSGATNGETESLAGNGMAIKRSLVDAAAKVLKIPIILLSFLLLTNCAVGPNFKRPPMLPPKANTLKDIAKKTVAAPTKMGASQSFTTPKKIPKQWWSLFHSKALNYLVVESFRHNPSVAAAKASLGSALEAVYAHRGAFIPFVGASFSPTLQQTARVLQSNLADNAYNYALYTGQLYVSYTLDLFGGIRRQHEALIAQAVFQRFELEATYLALSANVVNAAIQEASLREQIAATKKLIAYETKILNVLKKGMALGNTPYSEIIVLEAGLANLQMSLPPLQEQLAMQRNLLNALTGRFPNDPCTPKFTLDSLHLPTELPLSLPSTLLAHRPDIRAAQEQMHAANALIGVAVANRLPSVTLGLTNLGTTALELGGLFGPTSPLWAMAGLIAQPIYAGGTLMHRQRGAVADYQQAAAQYKLTVINAFQNVADTLQAIKQDANLLRAAYKAYEWASKSLMMARVQRRLGDTSILLILENEKLYQQARIGLIQAQANRLSDSVALFQALGGGWWCKSPQGKRIVCRG